MDDIKMKIDLNKLQKKINDQPTQVVRKSKIKAWLENGGYITWWDENSRPHYFIDDYAVKFPRRGDKNTIIGEGNWMVLE